MYVYRDHRNYKRKIQNADTRAPIEAILSDSETFTMQDVKLVEACVKFDIPGYNKTKNTTMYQPETTKYYSSLSRRPSILNLCDNCHHLSKYDINKEADKTYDRSYRDPHEEEIYNDYNFDGANANSVLTATPANTSYTKNIRNFDNLIAHSTERGTYQDFRINQNERNDLNTSDNKASSSKKMCAEKTTYCRPVFNVYNQELIYKTIERNAKLQLLLKKLVIARRKEKEEKEREEWNNYVNKLKNNYNYHSDEPRHIAPQYKPQERIYVGQEDDHIKYNNNQNSHLNYTQPRNNLPVYGHLEAPYCDHRHPEHERAGVTPGFEYCNENKPSCYITSSVGRLLTLPKDWQLRNSKPIPVDSTCKYEDTCKGVCSWKACPFAHRKEFISQSKYPLQTVATTGITINNASQTLSNEVTKIEAICDTQDHNETTTKEQYDEVTNNVNRLKNQVELQEQEMQRRNSLKGIESRLDTLASAIQAILSKLEAEKKVTGTSTACACGDRVSLHGSEKIAKATTTACECDHFSVRCPKRPESEEHPERPEPAIDTYNLQTKYTLRATPPKHRSYSSSTSRIDKIMCEELDKSNKLRKDIEELLYQSNPSCAVQISFDIPTRERSTEVTDSLSKTKLMEEEEISLEELRSLDQDRQITIAVNTDPMGLLAWFRMSSEALRQLISYVPCVDYSWYLSRIPLPQVANNAVNYVCNICGASFVRPSQLNDHIQTHDLRNIRNCCVCRHVLDFKQRAPGLFACEYCGQRFTRAYCCELHEQSCARALGRHHDPRPSLGLLR